MSFPIINGAKDVNSFFVKGWTTGYLWIATGLRPSQWQHPNTVIARAWKARGNLSMGYNYSFMEFFFFSVFVFIISGLWIASSFHFSQWRRAVSSDLWGLASLCKGGCCEATGGLREKLKIEAQSEKMICLHNHFSLSSHEVRNERSIRNWKLKINILFKINYLM